MDCFYWFTGELYSGSKTKYIVKVYGQKVTTVESESDHFLDFCATPEIDALFLTNGQKKNLSFFFFFFFLSHPLQ